MKRAPKMKSEIMIVNISGRGDKDIGIMRENLELISLIVKKELAWY
jgi:tryptophan synthase beta subunit